MRRCQKQHRSRNVVQIQAVVLFLQLRTLACRQRSSVAHAIAKPFKLVVRFSDQ